MHSVIEKKTAFSVVVIHRFNEKKTSEITLCTELVVEQGRHWIPIYYFKILNLHSSIDRLPFQIPCPLTFFNHAISSRSIHFFLSTITFHLHVVRAYMKSFLFFSLKIKSLIKLFADAPTTLIAFECLNVQLK